MFNFEPYKSIENSTDVEFLNNVLNQFIPIDRQNLEKDANKTVHEKMGINHEEYKKNTSEFLDKLEELVKRRLELLKELETK